MTYDPEPIDPNTDMSDTVTLEGLVDMWCKVQHTIVADNNEGATRISKALEQKIIDFLNAIQLTQTKEPTNG